MVIKSLHISVKIAGFLAICLITAALSFFMWVFTEQRSLEFVTPYIEKELNGISPNIKVDINESFIKWDSYERSFSILITDVKLHNDTNETIATLPKISFDFSIMSFLKGRILSSDMTILNPTFHVKFSDNELYVEPQSNGRMQEKFIKDISDAIAKNNLNLPIKSVRIKDADIYVDNGVAELVWKLREGYARLYREDGQMLLTAELNINFGREESYFKADIKPDNNKIAEATISFNNLPSYIISDIFPKVHELNNINIKSAGELKLLLEESGKISQLQFEIESDSGEVSIPQYFDRAIKFKTLKAGGNFYNNFSNLAINVLEAEIDNSSITIAGEVNNNVQWPDFSPNIEADVTINNLPVDELKHYWPLNLGEHARNWVLDNITGGKVTTAKGHFSFTAKDIQNMKDWHASTISQPDKNHPSPLRDKSIDAEIMVEGASVSYLESYPYVRNVAATVKFSGNSMDAVIHKGKFLESEITNGNVVLPDLWYKPVKIEIKTDFTGKTSDIAYMMAIHKKYLPENEHISSIYNSNGKASGTVSMAFSAHEHIQYEDMNLKINTSLKETNFPAFMNGKDFTNCTTDIVLDGMRITAIGSGNLNGNDIKLEYENDFSKDAPYNKKYKVSGIVTAKSLDELGIAKIPYIEDKFFIDVTTIEKDDGKSFTGFADVKNSAFSIKPLAFDKPAGSDGKIEFTAHMDKEGEIDVKNFYVSGNKLSASGNLKINKSELSYLNIEKAQFADNDLRLLYESDDKNLKVDIQGDILNLSEEELSSFFKNKKNKEKNINLNADFKTVYMKNGQVFNDFKASAKCTEEKCISANLYARLEQSNFLALSLKPAGERSSLKVESDNAGVVISALGISPNIRQGKLSIEASYTKENKQTHAKGIVHIKDFTAVKTPLLGKLLTLASFKGIFDLLDSEGITFRKFEAPFKMQGDIITIDNARSSGSSIGITSSGTIDTANNEIDLKGAIVPAYEVNKMLGNIPLVGNIIIGREGEGIIATKYTIKGPYEDAKVSVNPLSILTPGFLRNVFDIF